MNAEVTSGSVTEAVALPGGVVHEMPSDLAVALRAEPQALSTWHDITPLARNEWICWVISPKKPETRIKRIAWGCESLRDGKRRPCCWPGCSHRRTEVPGREDRRVTKYLISFPSAAMQVSPEEMPAVSASSRAVIAEAKAAGVYVFGGGIDESVAPVLVKADGSVSDATYPGSRLDGGFCVLEVPTRADAEQWAARLAGGCRCAQELREFMYDPAS